MKGTRPLDNDEIRRVSASFTGMFEIRNRGLFMLGVSTGGRISELLSPHIGDVYQNHASVTDLLYDRSKTYHSLKNINDNTSIRELQDRGYDITSPRNHETTAEIRKIVI